MRIVVLGGAGAIGREIARDLAVDSGVSEIVVADRDRDGAQRVAERLGRPGVRPAAVDVGDRKTTVSLLAGAGAVINAVQYDLNLEVMAACLEARTHYLDLGGLFHTTRRQLDFDEPFRNAGLLAILGIGSCPGVSNVQAGALARRLDRIDSIRIYNGHSSDPDDSLAWSYSIETILDEMTSPAMVFRDGRFQERPPLGEEERYRFEPPIGETTVHLSLHSEVATLPISLAGQGLRECMFKISRFGYSENAFARLRSLVDLGLASIEPMTVGGATIRPRDVLIGVLQRRAGARPPRPRGFKEIVTEARGTRAGRPVMIRARTTAGPQSGREVAAGTLLVAAPAAIVGRWLAAGILTATGVHPPELLIDPVPFFRELGERGATTVWPDDDPARG